MKESPKVIKIDNVEYVQKDSYTPAKKLDGLDYVIVRTYSAGCFAGYLESKKDQEVVLVNSRRLWYWDGAASLSQLAMNGVSKPENCKFPCKVEKIILNQVIEVIYATEESRESIESVKEWKA